MITPGHVEIPARDLERLAAFYRAVFGWTAEPLTWDGPAYCRLRSPARPAAPEGSAEPAGEGCDRALRLGLATAQPYPQPLLVLEVTGETLEAVVARVEVHGGSCLLAPHAVEPFGRFTVIADPEENRFGLWQSHPSR